MILILASPDALCRNSVLDQQLVNVMRQARANGNPTGVVSNHSKPSWFDAAFADSGVQFLQESGRQNGEIVARNAKKFSLHPFDALVLATKDEDVAMGKNGGALLVACAWSPDRRVSALGVKIGSASDLETVVKLTEEWPGKWWYSGGGNLYSVRALTDLSTKKYGLSNTQQAFAMALTSTVKNGGPKLNALLAVSARSLLMDGFGTTEDLMWGTYPSSKSDNTDTEVLSDFTHRLRTTVSRVQFAKKGEPLFIRHAPSTKRSSGGVADRTDPSEQLLTLHLNPFYARSSRVRGKNVVVIDDCTTYGVSFGVAASFLRAAGAASVTGIALGKFGSQLKYYDITIESDPFKPLSGNDFEIVSSIAMGGISDPDAQTSLQNLIE